MSSSRPRNGESRGDKRTRSLVALGITGLCAASLVALGVSLHRSTAHPPGDFDLVLEVQVGERADDRAAPEAPRGGALALNSLTGAERAQLAALLDDLADEAALRRNPLVEDLGGADRQHQLETKLRAWGPSFSAGAALAAASWVSGDGQMTVAVKHDCAPRPPATHCMRVAHSPKATGPIERRARLFAWPVTHAVVLRAVDAGKGGLLAGAMRAKLDREKTTVALVLERSELHGLRASLELAAVARATERLMEVLGDAGALSGDSGDLLARLARSTTTGDELPWLALPEGAVLVVPRLGALATRDVFLSEVARLAADAGVPFERLYEGE